MSDKPRRAWFQLHLSTAIVLMFVAGGLMHANLKMRYSYDPDSNPILDEDYRMMFGSQQYGWPEPIVEREIEFDSNADRSESISNRKFTPLDSEWIAAYEFWYSLIVDVLVALSMLAVATITCEHLIRRREARAP